MPLPTELQKLIDELDAADRDAKAVASGLSEAAGTAQPAPGAWSVAECLDHLATSNRVYLAPIGEAASLGRAAGRMRRRPALPGFVGGLFARSLEPPVNVKVKNPKSSTPRPSPPLAVSLAAFLESQEHVRAFIRANADLDLASIRFVNPFITWIRFSLATGLHVIASHDRRHLWQAANVRKIVAP
ncbi:MAG TPA: DinB family protein [Vicinamibacterales bacterium]|nr:DinB family protein [Vicinamibacterales bacterium]